METYAILFLLGIVVGVFMTLMLIGGPGERHYH